MAWFWTLFPQGFHTPPCSQVGKAHMLFVHANYSALSKSFYRCLTCVVRQAAGFRSACYTYSIEMWPLWSVWSARSPPKVLAQQGFSPFVFAVHWSHLCGRSKDEYQRYNMWCSVLFHMSTWKYQGTKAETRSSHINLFDLTHKQPQRTAKTVFQYFWRALWVAT